MQNHKQNSSFSLIDATVLVGVFTAFMYLYAIFYEIGKKGYYGLDTTFIEMDVSTVSKAFGESWIDLIGEVGATALTYPLLFVFFVLLVNWYRFLLLESTRETLGRFFWRMRIRAYQIVHFATDEGQLLFYQNIRTGQATLWFCTSECIYLFMPDRFCPLVIPIEKEETEWEVEPILSQGFKEKVKLFIFDYCVYYLPFPLLLPIQNVSKPPGIIYVFIALYYIHLERKDKGLVSIFYRIMRGEKEEESRTRSIVITGITALIISGGISYLGTTFGYENAKNEEGYYLIKKNNEMFVVIDDYKNNFIVAPVREACESNPKALHCSEYELITQFELIEQKSIQGQMIRTSGKLSVKRSPTVEQVRLRDYFDKQRQNK